jgi:hypothetical protein
MGPRMSLGRACKPMHAYCTVSERVKHQQGCPKAHGWHRGERVPDVNNVDQHPRNARGCSIQGQTASKRVTARCAGSMPTVSGALEDARRAKLA